MKFSYNRSAFEIGAKEKRAGSPGKLLQLRSWVQISPPGPFSSL
jgi:hypothetical protein